MNISQVNNGYAPAVSLGNFALSATDEVFATAVQFGRTVLDTAFRGVCSLQQLIAEVVKALGAVTGLVTIMVRNSTRGTVTRRVVRIGSGASRRSRGQLPAGTQLTLAL